MKLVRFNGLSDEICINKQYIILIIINIAAFEQQKNQYNELVPQYYQPDIGLSGAILA